MKNVPGNYYKKHKSKNPIVKYLMNNFHNSLFNMIDSVEPANMLDIGCGEGYTIKEVINRYPNLKIEGVDVEEVVIEMARQENPDINFRVESAYSLNSCDASYDLVTVLEVLEHLKDPDKAIDEARRVSKKYCIFSVPYEPYWRVLNVLRLKYITQLGNTPGHVNHWGKEGYSKLLLSHFNYVQLKTVFPWNFALCS